MQWQWNRVTGPHILVLLLPIIVFVAGVFLSFEAKRQQQLTNQQRLAASLQHRLSHIADLTLDQMTSYQFGVRELRNLVISLSPDTSLLQHLRAYGPNRDIELEFPGARGFGFIRKVRSADLSQFLQTAQQEQSFQLTQLAPHEGDLFIIQYVEPYYENKAAIGLDIASENSRREAALLAAQSNAPILTGPITLVQQSEKITQGFLLLFPIYQGLAAADVKQRYEQLIGWSYAPLLMDEILTDLLKQNLGMGLSISDITSEPEQLFFQSGSPTVQNPDLVQSKELAIFGRTWRLSVMPGEYFIRSMRLTPPERVFHVSIAVTVLATLFSILALMYWQRRRQLFQQQSLLTAIVANANEAIVGLNTKGQVIAWNPAARNLFGYQPYESFGKTLAELIVPKGYQQEQQQLMQQLAKGEQVSLRDTVRSNRQGQLIAVSIHASPIHCKEQQCDGFSFIFNDIRQLKANELHMREMNELLERQVQARTAQMADAMALQSSILHCTQSPIIATDCTGVIRLFNPAAEALLGYRAEALIGVATPLLFHDPLELESRAQQLAQYLDQPVRAGFELFIKQLALAESCFTEWSYFHQAGHRLQVHIRMTPLTNGSQEITGYLSVIHDLTQQKQLEFELALAKVSTEKTTDFVAWLKPNGDIMRVNPALAMSLGYPEAQVTHFHISQIIPNFTSEQWHEYQQVLCHSDALQCHADFVCFNGQRLPASIALVRVDLSQQCYVYLVGRDSTAQLAKENELAKARELAEGANRAKSQFIYNISHEITKSVEQIQQKSKELQHSYLAAKQQQLLQAMQPAIDDLQTLLSEMQDFSIVETGKVQLEQQRISWIDLLQSLHDTLSTDLKNKDVELMFDVAENLPAAVHADLHRLQQVLVIMLQNGLKLSQGRTIGLAVNALVERQSQILLRFQVTHLANLAEAEHLQLLLRSYRKSPVQLPQLFAKSAGLSLSICQRLVQLMGGTIDVRYQDGILACNFELWLTSHEIRSESLPWTQVGGAAMLIVEPSEYSASVLQKFARQHGYQADTVSNLAQAQQQLSQQAQRYELVLLNYWQDAGSSAVLNFAQHVVKQYPHLQGHIILMITPFQRRELAECWEAGQPAFDTVLLKPCSSRSFYLALQDIVTTAPLQTLPSALPSTMSATGRLAGLRILLVDENPYHRAAGARLVQQEGGVVVSAATGKQALAEFQSTILPFDLILVDLVLPDLDAAELVLALRQLPMGRQLPIIAISVQPLLADRLASLSAGMDEHLSKPIEMHQLVQIVIRLTQRQAGKQTPIPVEQVLSAELEAFVLQQQLELTTALQRLGYSWPVYLKTLQIFAFELEQQTQWLTQLDLSQVDKVTLHWCYRRLRNAAAVLGFSELAAILQRFEQQPNLPDSAAMSTLCQSLCHWQDIVQQGIVLIRKQEPGKALQQERTYLNQELTLLFAELQAADMHAVTRFSAIQGQLAMLEDSDSLNELDKLMNQLDFSAAMSIVRHYLTVLGVESNGA